MLTTYAGDVFFGPTKYVAFGALGGGSPWIQLARDVWGIGWVIAFLAILNSTFALLFYARRARSEFNWLLHAVIPVLGIVPFLPAWFTAMRIGGSVLKFVAPLSYPSSKTGLVISIWFLIGLIALIYLYVPHPQRLPEMKRVFSDDELSPAGQPVVTGETS